jgi:pimeloyl-ACP methyl ester carboxylesterase
MRRGWKILIAVIAALVVVLALNAIVTSKQTKPAEVTEPGGRILSLQGGDLQVVDRGRGTGSPIVLIHCFTCAINWWDRMIPLLTRGHRVIAMDLLGHGGSEKPDSGYSMPEQADLVAQALARLGVSNATVVGHSLGGAVAVALAERSPELVARVVILDTVSSKDQEAGLGLGDRALSVPLIGPALWRLKTDSSVRDGLGVAFAPGFDVPDAFVEDLDRMTYSAYRDSHAGFNDYIEERSLAERMKETGKPLLVIMGSEDETVDDPEAVLASYQAAIPTVFTNLIRGVGHSPNVEEPSLTSEFVLGFTAPADISRRARRRHAVQERMQKPEGVRKQP